MTVTTTGASALKAVLPLWHEQLQSWAQNGRLLAAAQEALMLQGTPKRLEQLIDQWATGNFRNIPEIVLLPNGDISGAMGAYAISTGKIYLNQDWLPGASAAQVVSVLTEELGHHLDGILNDVDTPGDEGLSLSEKLYDKSIMAYTGREQEKGQITISGAEIEGEFATSTGFGLVRQISEPGDNYYGLPSSDGRDIYIPSTTSGAGKLSKYSPTGTLIWERNIIQGGGDSSSSVASDGSVIVASSARSTTNSQSILARYDSAGSKTWEIQTSNPFIRAKAIGTVVYMYGQTGSASAPANSGFISAYSLETGTQLWTQYYDSIGASCVFDVESDSGGLYASCGKTGITDGIVLSLTNAGNVKWAYKSAFADWDIIYDIEVAGSSVYGAGFKANGTDREDASVVSINAMSGAVQWEQTWGDPNSQVCLSIVEAGGKLYTNYHEGIPFPPPAGYNGYVGATEIDAATGAILGTYSYMAPTQYGRPGAFFKLGSSVYFTGSTNGSLGSQPNGGGQDIYIASFQISNNTPTDIAIASSGIQENSTTGTLIGTLSATDPDAGSVFSYNLIPGDGTTDADNNLVTISGNQLLVKQGAVIDYETDQVLNLNIQVTDNGTPPLSITKSLTVNVLDVLEDVTPPTVSSIAVQGTTVILRFSEAVTAAAVPINAFSVATVTTSNVATARTISAVTVDQNDSTKVILTLTGTAPASNVNLRVSYTDPVNNQTTGVVQDVAGNDLASFSNRFADTFINGSTTTLASQYQNLILTGTSGVSGTGNALANAITGNTANNTLSGLAGIDDLKGDAGNDTLIGGASGDLLTGGIGNDQFRYALTDSLLASMDRITDLVIGSDTIDGPRAVTAANLRELGAVTALTQAGIAAVLTNAAFVANGAATFSFGTGATARTFLALNNGTAGFSSTADALIEITGYSGALTSLAVI